MFSCNCDSIFWNEKTRNGENAPRARQVSHPSNSPSTLSFLRVLLQLRFYQNIIEFFFVEKLFQVWKIHSKFLNSHDFIMNWKFFLFEFLIWFQYFLYFVVWCLFGEWCTTSWQVPVLEYVGVSERIRAVELLRCHNSISGSSIPKAKP